MRIVLMLALLMAAGLVRAQVVWEQSELGQTAIVSMEHAPYPHESRAEGFTRNDRTWPRDPHYVDSSVLFFIPNGYRAGESVDLLFFFHGHGNNVRNAVEQFGLREMVAASGKNVILVFPQGPKDASDSGGGKLEEDGGLERLAREALELLKAEGKTGTETPGRIILSGHSGAYKIIHNALDHGGLEAHVTDAFLLDASYGGLDEMVAWMAGHPEGRVRSIFTEHLANENVVMMARLQERGVPFTLLMDDAASDEHLRRERLLFLHTVTLDHNATVQMLGPWLRTSRLAERAPPQ